MGDDENIRGFSLGAVLSVTTGIIACADFGDVQDLIEHLAGRPVMTHELGEFSDLVQPGLRAQFPLLDLVVTVPQSAREGGEAGMTAWVDSIAAGSDLPSVLWVERLNLDAAAMKAARRTAWAAIGLKAVDS